MIGTLAPLFTPETARENAAKSVEKRRQQRLAGEKAIARLAELERCGTLEPVNQRAERLDKQMTEIEVQMKGATADEKAKLSAAFDRLFGAWCILTGTQLPSKAKVSRRNLFAPIAPIESPALPAAPAPAPLDPAAPKSEDCTG